MASTQEPWDHGGFVEAVDEIRRLSGELYYVDKAIEYVDTWVNYPSTSEAYSDVVRFDVEIGWTHPFTKHVERLDFQVDSDYAGKVQETLQGFADDGAAWATGNVQPLIGRVDDITTPIADNLTYAAEAMRDHVQNTLVTEISNGLSADLQKSISEWWGGSAEAFWRDFVTPWGDAKENQIFLADGLGVCMAAGAAIIRQSQHSLMNAVVSTRDTLDDALKSRQATQEVSLSAAEVLALASSGTALLGAFDLSPVGKTVTAVTNSILNLARSAVEKPEPIKFEGRSAEELQNGLEDAVTKIITHTQTHWDDLNGGQVSELAQDVAAMSPAKPLYPPRPDIADGPVRPGDFHHTSSSNYTG